MKNLLIAVLVLLPQWIFCQNQTIELCEADQKTFQYTAIGSPNCQWKWQVFFNERLIITEYNEDIRITFDKPGNYRLTLKIENELCESEPQEYQILVIECRRPILLVPTAFTPNKSGLNDIFKIQGVHIQSMRLEIFNRWGKLIFVSTDMGTGWDGTLNGSPAPEGAYICVVDYIDVFGNFGQKVTSLTLYR
jgi:gliding motility-associated-like protein